MSHGLKHFFCICDSNYENTHRLLAKFFYNGFRQIQKLVYRWKILSCVNIHCIRVINVCNKIRASVIRFCSFPLCREVDLTGHSYFYYRVLGYLLPYRSIEEKNHILTQNHGLTPLEKREATTGNYFYVSRLLQHFPSSIWRFFKAVSKVRKKLNNNKVVFGSRPHSIKREKVHYPFLIRH